MPGYMAVPDELKSFYFLCRNSLPQWLCPLFLPGGYSSNVLQMCLQPQLLALGPPTRIREWRSQDVTHGENVMTKQSGQCRVRALQVMNFEAICLDLPLHRMSQRRMRGFKAQKKSAFIRISTRIINFKAEKPYRILEENWEDFISSLPWHPMPLEVWSS